MRLNYVTLSRSFEENDHCGLESLEKISWRTQDFEGKSKIMLEAYEVGNKRTVCGVAGLPEQDIYGSRQPKALPLASCQHSLCLRRWDFSQVQKKFNLS